MRASIHTPSRGQAPSPAGTGVRSHPPSHAPRDAGSSACRADAAAPPPPEYSKSSQGDRPMRRSKDPGAGVPLWFAVMLLGIFAATMFGAGFMFCRLYL